MAKGLGLGVVNGEEVARFVYIAFSLVIRISPFLLVQGGCLSHARFISCFQGKKARTGSLSPAVFSDFLEERAQYQLLEATHFSNFKSSGIASSNLSISILCFCCLSPLSLRRKSLGVFLFCFVFLFRAAAQPGIEPAPSAVKAQSSNHRTTRELPEIIMFLPCLKSYSGFPLY